MEKTSKLAIIITLFLWTGCLPPGPLEPPPPPPVDGEPCDRACQRLEQLGCPEADPDPGRDGIWGTRDDIACVQWMCTADYLDHEAIATANSCEEANL